MSTPIFLDGTTFARNRLDMVNRCLRAIGEIPYPAGTLVDSLALGTDGETAARIVAETMVEVQSIGWYFNLDYNFKLYVDSNSVIVLPPNLIRMDTVASNRYMSKNGQVYDNENHTFIIDVPSIEADIVWLVDYEVLPAEAYEYIAARSARKFQEYVLGAPDLSRSTTVAEQDAFIRVQRRQLQSRAYNIQNERVSTRSTNAKLRPGLSKAKGRL